MTRCVSSSHPIVLFFSLLLLLLCTGCSRGVFPAPNEGILELVPLAVPESYIIGQVKQRSSGALATQAADDGLDWNSARLKLKMQNSVYANGQVAVRPKGITYSYTVSLHMVQSGCFQSRMHPEG